MAGLRAAYIGIDAAKARNVMAIADDGRHGELRYLGEFDATPESMRPPRRGRPHVSAEGREPLGVACRLLAAFPAVTPESGRAASGRTMPSSVSPSGLRLCPLTRVE